MIIHGGIQVKVSGGEETIVDCKQKIDSAHYGDEPVEIKSDDVLRACAVGLGSMGIVYSITYRCVPVYNLKEVRKVVHVPWSPHEEFEVPEMFADMYTNCEEGEYFSFFVNPYPMHKPSCCCCGGG